MITFGYRKNRWVSYNDRCFSERFVMIKKSAIVVGLVCLSNTVFAQQLHVEDPKPTARTIVVSAPIRHHGTSIRTIVPTDSTAHTAPLSQPLEEE